MDTNAIGLDIGGANLKLATARGTAKSRSFALWKHPEKLAAELRDFAGDFEPDVPIGVTMTGELCDCFRTKREGVRHIVKATEEAFRGRSIRYWTTDGQFVDAEAGCEQPIKVAAANWHAQATFVGRFAPQGFALLMDMGSTTFDIVPVRNGVPVPVCKTDAQRLVTGELLYFGCRRTPLAALLKDACAELFSTVHDVHVLAGRSPEEPHNTDTADGRPMTREYAWERVARMLGFDREMPHADAVVTRACDTVMAVQKQRWTQAVTRVQSLRNDRATTVLVSGSGAFVTREWVAEMTPTPQVIQLSETLGELVSHAACAYAVAVLRAEHLR